MDDVERIISQLKRPTTKTAEATRPMVQELFFVSELDEGLRAIMKFGGVPPLAELLGNDDEEIRSCAEAILVRLSSEPSCLRTVVEALVGVLKHTHGKTGRQLMQAAAALSDMANTGRVRDYLGDGHAVDVLVGHLSSSHSPELREHVLSTILTLTSHSPIIKGNVHRAGKIQPLLLNCLSRSDTTRLEKSLSLTLMMEMPGGPHANVPCKAAGTALLQCIMPTRCDSVQRVFSQWRAGSS